MEEAGRTTGRVYGNPVLPQSNSATLDKSVKPLCLSLIVFEMGKNGIYASSGKTRRVYIQLDKGPETPGTWSLNHWTTREAPSRIDLQF